MGEGVECRGYWWGRGLSVGVMVRGEGVAGWIPSIFSPLPPGGTH